MMEIFKQEKNIKTDDMLKTDKILHLSFCFFLWSDAADIGSVATPPRLAPREARAQSDGVSGLLFHALPQAPSLW